MHTVDKGEIARYLTVAHLIEKGAIVSIPTTENTHYDLIADFNGKLIRVQVKKGRLRHGCLRIALNNPNNKTIKTQSHFKYSSKHIDWLIGVDTDNKKFYLLDYTTGLYDDRDEIWLRVDDSLRRNKRAVYAKDFEY